jgi:hypothetical protein
MAQTGFTPIQLYRTTTASTQPTAGNLAAGELAINLTDKKLYAKDASNNVFLLADASSGGTTAANLAGGAAGSLPYQTGANATTFLGIGTAGQVLQVNSGATAPQWVSSSGTGDVARTTSPSFTTPSLGVATATSINKVLFTAPATVATLTIADGKTLAANSSLTLAGVDGKLLTINNSLVFAGTDATTMTFPSTSASLARTDAAQTFTGTQTFAPAANTSGIVSSSYSLTGANAQALVDLSGTWNTTGTPAGIRLNITDTASNAASLLLDLQVGGVSRFSAAKNGSFSAGPSRAQIVWSYEGGSFSTTKWTAYLDLNTVTTQILGLGLNYIGLQSVESINWSNGFNVHGTGGNVFDLSILRDAANTLAQRNGVNAQTLRVYNTFTDGSNFERGRFAWASNVLTIGTENAGTGLARELALQTSGTDRIRIDTSGNVCVGANLPDNFGTGTNNLEVRSASGLANFYVNGAGTLKGGLVADVASGFLSLRTVTNHAITFNINFSEKARITPAGNVVAGGSIALATNATDGFLYVPTCAGIPTGVPTAITGMAPIVVNTTNNKLYFYSGGAWRDAGP